MNEIEQKIYHVHLVSDATGETINNIARACLVQFEGISVEEHFWSLVRSQRQLDLVKEGLRQWPGLVLYTFVDESLRDVLSGFCRQQGLKSLPVLEPILSIMASFFDMPFAHAPGRQHALDEEYFARIDAMDFALAQDDGHQIERLNEADVVIFGVSRTSKTPTSIYLSHRGIKVANVPIVPEVPLNIDFKALTKPLLIGLTKNPDSLVETRLARIKMLHERTDTDYTDPEKVREEVVMAKKIFLSAGCHVIDVTRRSIEETAAEIMTLINKRNLQREISHQGSDT